MAGLIVGLSASALPGCRGGFEGCEPGTEGCECADLECNVGLVCAEEMCIPEATGGGDTSDGAGDGGSGDTTGDAGTSTTGAGSTGGTSGTTGGDTSTGETSTGDATTGDGTTGSGTSGTTSTGPVCGDGVIDPGEECDGGPGCTACELDNWDCNPLNNEPCTSGTKCTYREPMPGDPSFTCVPFLEPPPGQLHEGNCFSFEPRDEWCDIGLACVTTQSANACMDTGVNCCVEFCDATDPTFVCANPNDECVSFWAGAVPEGLAHLGFCVIP